MIRRWHLKAVVQKLISWVPVYGHKLNYTFQKYITKGVRLTDDYFNIKTVHLNDNFRYLQKYQQHQLQHILEIGTGWYPINPVGFYLLGADQIMTYDISPLMDVDKVLLTCRFFLDKKSELELRYGLEFDNERLKGVERILAAEKEWDLEKLLSALSITSLVGYLVDDDLLAGRKVENVVSNNTLEHIPKKELERLFEYLRPRLGTNGVMSHFVDMTDHYAHMDSSITVYNFLQFGERLWRMIDNEIQPMNRLRYPEYKDIHKMTGFEIIEEHSWDFEEELLDRQDIHEEFSERFTREEMAKVHVYFVSRVRE